MKKYRTGGFELIEKIEVQRETYQTVWIEGRMFRKNSSWQFYDTFEDARRHLVHEELEKIDLLQKKIGLANERIEKIKALKNPEEATQ